MAGWFDGFSETWLNAVMDGFDVRIVVFDLSSFSFSSVWLSPDWHEHGYKQLAPNHAEVDTSVKINPVISNRRPSNYWNGVITVKNQDQLCCTRTKVDCHPNCEDSETVVVSKLSRSWCLLAWQGNPSETRPLWLRKLQAFPQIVYQLDLVEITRSYRVTSFSLLTTSTAIALFVRQWTLRHPRRKTNCPMVSVRAHLTTTQQLALNN